jgi:hypothetical protein
VEREEKFRGARFAVDSIEVGQLLELVGKVLDVKTAHLSKEDLPLAEEDLRFGILGCEDLVVKRADPFLGKGTFGSEVAVEVFRLCFAARHSHRAGPKGAVS